MENDQRSSRIYVAIGADLFEGFATLDWTLKKWASASVKIVILYSDNNICKDFVYTPIGKFPVSSVSKGKMKALDKSEEARTDKILSKFVAFCGKVKAEGIRINDRYEDPNHKVILRLITSLHITKLVMASSFFRPPSWKSRNAASASLSLHREKPDFCELFVIHEGKLAFLREEKDEKLSDRSSFKGWIGKFFQENACGNSPSNSPSCSSPASSSMPSLDQWEKHREEIDKYFNELSTSLEANGTIIRSPSELDTAKTMEGMEKEVDLKVKIRDTQETIRMNKEEAKANTERYAKAKWAIALCTSRVDDLEALTDGENSKRMELQKEMVKMREELSETQSEVEEKRSKLESILQLQQELSNKLHLSSTAKSRAESQLEKSVRERAEVVQEIEDIRQQRNVFQRRIEFCKEKDAIERASRMSDLGFDYRMFTASEIRAATEDFAQRLRFKSAGDWTNVYKGRLVKTTVAIKLFESAGFSENVRLLGRIRHPHVLSIIGFCTDLNCIAYEYMHNGCLRDTLFSRHKSRGGRCRGLSWHDRVRVAAEVCTALNFLHKAKPRPLVHGSLNPSRILLDRNNVAKIYGFKTDFVGDNNAAMAADIQAFGTLLLQLLTGRNWAGISEEAIMMDSTTLTEALDKMAGEWPMDLAVELAGIARRCLSTDETEDSEFSSTFLMRWVEKVRKSADELMANAEGFLPGEFSPEERDIPSVFFCPIYQDVMKNPYIAADGFSYELEGIEEWLRTGRDTSPMTNLKLRHRQLIPNHTLRSLIEDWHNHR